MSGTELRSVWTGRRADRARADAERTRANAAAQLTLVEAEGRRLELEDAATRRRQQLADDERERRDRRRADRRADRAHRWGRRREAVADGVADLARSLPLLAGVVACVAPTAVAVQGQYAFAHDVMKLGASAWLVPAMLEGAAWFLAWRRHRAVVRREPLGWLTPGVWVLALTAAAMNLWHGASPSPEYPAGNLQVGVMFALATLIGFGLVELLARHGQAAARPRGERVGLRRAVRFPPVAFAAWSRMVELGPDADAAEAWVQAWRDRYDVDPGATRDERNDGRLQVRARDWGRRNGPLDLDDEVRGDDPAADVDELLLELVPVDLDPADEDEPQVRAVPDWVDEPDEQLHFCLSTTELPDPACETCMAAHPWRDPARPLPERLDLAVAELVRRAQLAIEQGLQRSIRPIGRRRAADLAGLEAESYEVRKAWDERPRRDDDGQEISA